MSIWTKRLLLLLILFLLYFLFFPTGLDINKWEPPTAPEFSGALAPNDLLSRMEVLYQGQCDQCEDIAIDDEGNIYGGEINGNIKFFKNGSASGKVIANTSGRPLGLHFDLKGNLIIADAYKGILSLAPDGSLTTMTNSSKDYVFKFADDLELDSNGVIYFSDASDRFGFHENNKNILENQPSGALYEYDSRSKETLLLIDDMYFANGVAVDHNEQFVLVNETTRYRIRKYWIAGPKKGQWEIFMENLPGFPDGISRGEEGIFWVAFASPRLASFDKILPYPFVRHIIARLPKFLQPKAVHFGMVLGIDADGNIVYNLQDPSGGFGEITSVQQYGDQLFIGSLYENGIGVFNLMHVR